MLSKGEIPVPVPRLSLNSMLLFTVYSNALMTSLNSRGTNVSEGSKPEGIYSFDTMPSHDFARASTSMGVIHVSTDVVVADQHSQPRKQVEEIFRAY